MKILNLQFDERLKHPSVTVFNRHDTIQNHYAMAKLWIVNGYRTAANNQQQAKHFQSQNLPQIGWLIGKHFFRNDPGYLEALWYRFLKGNPEILWYIQQYDEVENLFNNRQAKIVSQVLKSSIESLRPAFHELVEGLKKEPILIPEALSIKEFATLQEQLTIESIPNIEEILTSHYGKPIKPRFLCRTEATQWLALAP